MFGDILEVQGSSPTHPFGSVSLALGAHLAMLFAIAAGSYLVIEKIHEPPVPFVPESRIVVIELPVSESPGPGATPPRGTGGVAPVVRTPEREQPATVPTTIQETPGPVVNDDGAGDLPLDGPPGVPWGDLDAPPGGMGNGPLGLGPGGSGSGAGPIRVDDSVVAPELLVRVQPEYPTAARLARLTGNVIVEAVIGRDGGVEDVRVLSATSPIFIPATVDAVRQWRYRPARQNGAPVAVYFTVEVNFVLQ